MDFDWLKPAGQGVRIAVRVQPRARRSEISGPRDGVLRIRLQAPPVDGKANRALLKFLAGQLGVPASTLTLVQGDRHRNKIIHVAGITLADVQERLQKYMAKFE